MHNLRHFYYQNKEKIWKVVLIIAFLLGIIYFLNWKAMEESSNANNIVQTKQNVVYEDEQNKTYISNQSAIYGSTVTENQVKTINNTISKFLQYCKNGNVEEAYNMLSSDCKENSYSTIEQFQNKYINTKFGEADVFEIENWINNTYKVSISKDLLATGDIINNQKQIEYITIVKENSEEKLNINSYIGQKSLNKENTEKDVKITVISKKIYMDYEIYDFKIENLSNKTIKIDSLEKIGTMYLEDSKGNKYNAQSSELFEEDLEIKSNHQVNLSMKYTNKYSSNTQIESIIFKNIILDYIEYKKAQNTKDFEDICELKINL